MDGEGVWAKPPCYLELRFTAQSAPGTWPAFWTITGLDRGEPGDELDIIEAYGGVGSAKRRRDQPRWPKQLTGRTQVGYVSEPDGAVAVLCVPAPLA
jgi:hypothetical protein